jgi:anti-sigma factor RsiW
LNCQELRHLLHGYVDGELDLVRSLEIERHLGECPACARLHQSMLALRTALQSSALSFRAPPGMRQRVRAALRRQGKARRPRRLVAWPWLAVAAAAALLVALTWSAARLVSIPSADDLIAREVVSGHVRSLMARGPTDVASSNRHTVKPWFNGKVPFSPPVFDLADRGFPLVGGRLDYLDERRVAALVYRRRAHVINLFIWPSSTDSTEGTTELTRQGFHLFHWTRAGMTYWAISDLAPAELAKFVRLVQQRV